MNYDDTLVLLIAAASTFITGAVVLWVRMAWINATDYPDEMEDNQFFNN